MIKVIEGLKVKMSVNIEPILQRIRGNEVQYPGFVSDEYLIGHNDVSKVVLLLSIWQSFKMWRLWEESRIRRKLFEELQELLEEEPRIGIYTVHPVKLPATSRW